MTLATFENFMFPAAKEYTKSWMELKSGTASTMKDV
jgi:hypothetical protein